MGSLSIWLTVAGVVTATCFVSQGLFIWVVNGSLTAEGRTNGITEGKAES